MSKFGWCLDGLHHKCIRLHRFGGHLRYCGCTYERCPCRHNQAKQAAA